MQMWTDEQVKLLIELRGKGHSSRAIARQLGKRFTRNAVLGKLHRLGLKLSDIGQNHGDRVREGIALFKGRKNRFKHAFAVYPLPAETETPPETAVTFADLEDTHCRYIFGSGLSALYCGKEQTFGSSYCVHHHNKCHLGG